MSGQTCSPCGRPVRDAVLCATCTAKVEKDLAELPALATDLDITRTRTSRTGGRALGIVVRSHDRPMPWDDRAARVARDLVKHLDRWVQISRQTPLLGPRCTAGPCPHRTCQLLRSRSPRNGSISALAEHLVGKLPVLRQRQDITDLARQTRALIERAKLVIDRPQDLTFYGPCGAIDYWPDGDPILCAARCPADLYGEDQATELTCGTCGAEHDVTAVRVALLLEAEDQLVTAADLSKFLSVYGEPISAERIRQWASRGLIEPHGTDKAGRPVYFVRDAVDRLAQVNQARRKASA